MKTKATKEHHKKKSPGSAEHFRKLRKARNESRPKQRWVPSSFTGTIEELDRLGDADVLAIVPAHWERP